MKQIMLQRILTFVMGQKNHTNKDSIKKIELGTKCV